MLYIISEWFIFKASPYLYKLWRNPISKQQFGFGVLRVEWPAKVIRSNTSLWAVHISSRSCCKRKIFECPKCQTLQCISKTCYTRPFAGCHFPRELTNIVRRKCLQSQEILMEIFENHFLVKTLKFFNGTWWYSFN